MHDFATPRRTEVIGVASGKGGVGKTTLAVNLAVALQQSGRRVLLFDADLGLANAQLALGVGHRVRHNLSHVLSGRMTLDQVLIDVRPGLLLVPGASGVAEMAALDARASAALVQAFSALEGRFDVMVVDIAAGLSPSVLTFLSACTRRLVVLRDEPSSVADAYGLVKVMSREMDLEEVYLVPNMVASARQGDLLVRRLIEVCSSFLDRTITGLPGIAHDDSVLEAQRAYRPLLEHAPGGPAARDVRRLAQALMSLPATHGGGGLQFFIERLMAADSLAGAHP
jgi:flagellar biosynthesis protein FlhG